MKALTATMLVLLGLLQYRLWVGDGSLAEVWRLRQQIEFQKGENAAKREQNRHLEAEVADLKQGLEAIEERARFELGMVGKGEVFYMLVD